MSTKVEIIGNNIIFYPEDTIAAFGISTMLDMIQGDSTDPDTINKRFEVSMDKVLQQEDD